MSATAWKKEKEARSGGMSSSGAVQNTLPHPSCCLQPQPLLEQVERHLARRTGHLPTDAIVESHSLLFLISFFSLSPLYPNESHTHTHTHVEIIKKDGENKRPHIIHHRKRGKKRFLKATVLEWGGERERKNMTHTFFLFF
jgi:hypothetical protein